MYPHTLSLTDTSSRAELVYGPHCRLSETGNTAGQSMYVRLLRWKRVRLVLKKIGPTGDLAARDRLRVLVQVNTSGEQGDAPSFTVLFCRTAYITTHCVCSQVRRRAQWLLEFSSTRRNSVSPARYGLVGSVV